MILETAIIEEELHICVPTDIQEVIIRKTTHHTFEGNIKISCFKVEDTDSIENFYKSKDFKCNLIIFHKSILCRPRIFRFLDFAPNLNQFKQELKEKLKDITFQDDKIYFNIHETIEMNDKNVQMLEALLEENFFSLDHSYQELQNLDSCKWTLEEQFAVNLYDKNYILWSKCLRTIKLANCRSIRKILFSFLYENMNNQISYALILEKS